MQLYNQTNFYKGKVRDVYSIGEDLLVMVASDRISAFDHILPRTIPYKGQVLNQTAQYFLDATRDIVPNWLEASPLPNVSIGVKCEPIPIEVVVRGNLTGHALRTYQSGLRELSGVALPDGMRDNDYFPSPIITPTTKAMEGHDEDISRDDILSKGLVPENIYNEIENIALKLFERGRDMAAEVGLLLVDTKYEFGLRDGQIMLMDEIHTPDSSRYFELDGLNESISQGLSPKQLSKEFVREWLMSNGFQGKEGQVIPEMTDEIVADISQRYIQLYERLTSSKFVKGDHDEDIESKINLYLQELNYQ